MVHSGVQWWVLLVGAAVFAAACSAAPTPTPAPTPRPTPEPTATPTATPAPTLTPVGGRAPTVTDDGVIIDSNVDVGLGKVGFSSFFWDTDFTRRTVDLAEIDGVVPRDAIRAIDSPSFDDTVNGDLWLDAREPVIQLEIDGDARAYPLQILTWHEIVNNTVGGVPVAVTFCPLCNSAVVFKSTVDGEVLVFGVSGNLRFSDLIMFDRSTQSWWQQLTGEGIVGTHAGRQLEFVPAPIVAWETFRSAFPDGRVLSRDTGFNRSYGINPYSGYDTLDRPPFLYDDPTDPRLLTKERVVAVDIDGTAVAYPYVRLQETRVANDTIAGQDVAVFWSPGTVSALDHSVIIASEDIGATGVFDPNVDGERLTFVHDVDADAVVDEQTGSTWNILGEATDGPLAGTALTRLNGQDHFWFAWGLFRPDTSIWGGPTQG